jgi:hypothetical protein
MYESIEQRCPNMGKIFTSFNNVVTAPWVEIIQLNTKTANNILANNKEWFERCIETQKPEEMMSCNLERINKNYQEIMAYSQELRHMVTNAFSKGSDIMVNGCDPTADNVAKPNPTSNLPVSSQKEKSKVK